MSDRVPVGYGEAFFEYRTATDPQPCFTSLGLQMEDGLDLTTFADDVLDAWASNMKAVCANVWTIGPGHVMVGTADPVDLQFDGTHTTTGDVSGAPLPDAMAWLVRKQAFEPGRRGRGRMFVPGVPAGSNEAGGQLTDDGVTNLQNALDAFITDLNAIDHVTGWVLLHASAPFTPSTGLTLQAGPLMGNLSHRMRP